MALTTLADVKTYLALTKTTQDVFLQDLIDATFVEVENYLGQPIKQIAIVANNLVIDGNDIILPYTVPCGIISIKYKMPFESNWTDILPTEYYTYYSGKVQRIKFNQLNTNLIYEIVLGVGYVDANIPLDILSVIIELVAFKYKESVQGENILGKETVTTNQNGLVSTNRFLKNDFYQSKLKILNKYKRITN